MLGVSRPGANGVRRTAHRRHRLRQAAIATVLAAAPIVWCRSPAAWTFGAGPMASPPMAQSETRSVWDGVFSEEQASRGQTAYADACGVCHRDDLGGNEDGAPPLAGTAFLARWTGRPLSEFSFVLAETMPQDTPGSLTSRQYTEIIAFILKRNGAGAGKADLPEDQDRLGRIVFGPRPRLRR
jgi:hypothetical protein